MARRPALAALLSVASLIAGACNATLSDPKEIIVQGFEATSDLATFHVAATVDGEISMPGSEGTISLEGTTLDADVNVADEQAHLSFGVPAFLGLTGELIQLGTDGYVQLSMIGPKWYHLEQGSAQPSPSPSVDPVDELRDFLAKEGVEARKLEDVACGERQCYQVELTIPSEVLREAEASAEPLGSPGTDPAELIGDELVMTLLFDRENLWLVRASSSVDNPDGASFSVSITLSAFGEPVTISPPPADLVEESGFEFPLE